MENMPDYSAIFRLAQSPEGRKLIAMLQSSDSGALNTAMSNARKGDYEGAKQILTQLLNDPQARELLENLGGQYGGNGR